ncbi:GntR family transcriptional regulator [Ruegeria pomeroyi]|uniref:Transcriptional regulator, GntR family n=2 Tax=Ruegeria pomeroyi TaxID=89184 RepID=Q5LSP3_RUEPO|nr:GntR family transcriptional regulator [Ruegeria pomeroyi]HCE70853.1 GntR family transcriptional regulator [Ruegeria sp.]AAV95004.1 transcriptional regulator, GntR family [Ruegeria pomeroyi DSS-3]NVK99259.1 GntR family transcriptional regulator [Ruegeria pomeroyi]NVL02295.1 GntR family transcriptional regulator [Ruegeria pomeroyi]QWV08584.1 GntR family transcriptional regulator [Ruegeria pomeroyi]
MRIERNSAWELDPAVPITPQITRILRERIIQNDLKPGDRISESELARAYDVSRQPIREAFIKLADQGLVEVRPQRGTIITKIGYAAVLDARFLREAIEADIAKILAADPDRHVIAELRDQLARQASLDRRDPGAFIRLDELFHRTLAEAAGKGGAWKQIEGLKSQMDRVRYLALGEFGIETLVRQHRAIVDQIELGDVAGSNKAVRHHLREVLKDLPQIVEANRSSFQLPDGDMPLPVNAPIQGGN